MNAEQTLIDAWYLWERWPSSARAVANLQRAAECALGGHETVSWLLDEVADARRDGRGVAGDLPGLELGDAIRETLAQIGRRCRECGWEFVYSDDGREVIGCRCE